MDRLSSGRVRINVNAARNWFTAAVEEFGSQCLSQPRAGPGFELEVFTRAVTAKSFGRDRRGDLPETFFLDSDRLRTVRAEVDDLVMFEVCMDMCVAMARQFGYKGPITLAISQQLRAALSAIMAEAVGHGAHQWMMNSGALSLEILRHASRLAGQPDTHGLEHMAEANQSLRVLFVRRTAHHAARLEASLLPQILANVDRHKASSPVDLFANLVPVSPSMPPLSSFSRASTPDALALAHLHPETAKLIDLANRIAHIILLHWRVWAPLAYVPDDASRQPSPAGSATSSPASPTQP